jgi:hypothetical protein
MSRPDRINNIFLLSVCLIGFEMFQTGYYGLRWCLVLYDIDELDIEQNRIHIPLYVQR